MWRDWTRNEKIGFGSLIATIIGTLATIAAIPDTRQWLSTLGINAASVVPFARGQRVVINEEQLRRLCDVRLTEHDVGGLTGSELEILRNSIFAFHGRTFNRKDLRELFLRQTWYRPDATCNDSRLSKADWYNIETRKGGRLCRAAASFNFGVKLSARLMVSVSRHLWVTQLGEVRHQQKQFEISLSTLPRSSKRHIVHYLVRDHFSGAFYAEVAVTPTLPDVRLFLQRSWARKDRLSFCGVPQFLTVPRTVEEHFPGLSGWANEHAVDVIEATSGFQAGVRDLKTWEDGIRHASSWYPDTALDRLPALAEMVCFDLTERELFKRPHVNRWRDGLRSLRLLEPDAKPRELPRQTCTPSTAESSSDRSRERWPTSNGRLTTSR